MPWRVVIAACVCALASACGSTVPRARGAPPTTATASTPALLLAMARSGRLGSSIVIDLGTNGGMSTSVVGEMLDVAAGRRVVMVTSHCGYCSWTPTGNATVRGACIRQRNCVVADWDALARAHPWWFGGDGVHMTVGGAGAYAYAHLVQNRLRA